MVAAYPAAASLQQAQLTESQQQQQQQQKKLEENGRAPLALSEKNNGIPRKPRSREVTSRYKTATTSSSGPPTTSARRCPSPTVGRILPTPDALTLKRAQSAERRRPSPSPTPVADSKVANGSLDAGKRTPGRGPEGLWPSTRSLSVSMQRDSFSSREKSNGHTVDHTLKPAANIVQRTGDSASNLQRKATPERRATPERKGTPERKRTPRRQSTESENARPVDNSHSKPDQHRWPGKSSAKVIGNALTRSVDLTDRPSRVASLLMQGQSALGLAGTPRSVAVNRAFQRSINEGPAGNGTSNAARRASFDGRIRVASKSIDPCPTEASNSGKSNVIIDENNRPGQSPQEVEHPASDACTSACDLASEDSESVSSGSNSVAHETTSISQRSSSGGHISRNTTVPPRFWQESNNRLHRLSGVRSSAPESDISSGFPRSTARSKVVSSGTGHIMNGPERAISSPRFANRFQATPLSGPQHSVSPIKVMASSSPSRGLPSPTRTRLPPSVPPTNSLHVRSHSTSSVLGASSLLNFGVDVRKGKKGTSQVEEAHHLRILHNRLLQWRFVNARAEAAMNAQKVTAEKLLYNVWVTTSELRNSVTMKRIKLQQVRQENKLSSILRGQMLYLEEWALLERDHSNSLSGAVEALEAATLRLPVTGGARADIQAVKEAVSSAVDVMQAMGSSICSLLPKVEGMNHLVSELAEVAAQEKALLDECVDFLATTAAMEVEESSLRAHSIQLKQGRCWGSEKSMDNSAVAVDFGRRNPT